MTQPSSPEGTELDRATLDLHLQGVARWSDEQANSEVEALRHRLADLELRVLLVGEAKRGKSTLGNAILGRDLLPTGVRPVTAITTSIGTGTPERIEVTFADGTEVDRPIDDLAAYVTEQGNPLNARGVTSVRVALEHSPISPALLVDTPGVGSVLTHNTDQAEHARTAMDIAIFVLTADPPISLSERRLLEEVRTHAVATLVVLNKADRLSADELEEAATFVSEVAGTERVFACSARSALAARLEQDEIGFEASGVKDLFDTLTSRIWRRAEQDLVQSVAADAHRVTIIAMGRIRVTRAALEAIVEDRADEVDLFTREVAQATATQDRAHASIAWESRRVRRELDGSATEHTRRTSLHLLGKLDGFATQLDSRRAEELARAAVAALIESHVDAWRRDRLTALQDSLLEVIGDQQEHMDRVAAQVSASAQRLLGTDVHPIIEPLTVPDTGGFYFDFSPEVGWNTSLVEGVRRHLPARWRRRTVASHLRSESISLADKQYGRARSDLQRRLEAAYRGLEREVTARLQEQRDGMSAALATASRLQTSSREEQGAHLVRLGTHLDALDRLSTLLHAGASAAGEATPRDHADPGSDA